MNGFIVVEKSGAVLVKTSSMAMEVMAITPDALELFKKRNRRYTRAVIVTDSMSTLKKIREHNSFIQTGLRI